MFGSPGCGAGNVERPVTTSVFAQTYVTDRLKETCGSLIFFGDFRTGGRVSEPVSLCAEVLCVSLNVM